MITVYTTPHCPQCKLLKAKLAQANIQYELCEDVGKMRELGIMSVPIMEADGKRLKLREALDYLKERQQ